ncbi:MAG TPA: 5-oxoprolinase subunit PxpB [Vicinamibacterales bacterium]|nr:5-oxoprolinase subunit PxpB [Vicinamibacterales bacterium]
MLPLGDAAAVVSFGDEFSEAVNDRVMALAGSLRERPLPMAVRDVVPAIASLAVHVDPRRVRVEALIEALAARAGEIARGQAPSEGVRGAAFHEIPVRYGGDEGPDLGDVAAFAGLDAAGVVARHAERVYRVYMLGFLPGFAYLGQVDPSIAAPRRSSPRLDVPMGSVGIAGRQTGVYPQVSPGGWQIIGRTSLSMFDAASGRSLLQPGDRVRFVAERR